MIRLTYVCQVDILPTPPARDIEPMNELGENKKCPAMSRAICCDTAGDLL